MICSYNHISMCDLRKISTEVRYIKKNIYNSNHSVNYIVNSIYEKTI